ncbi:aspartic peptidase domain-containing protein [Mycena metata]|uniref:Aspartic peptidase domain-containing protein n=1 Tax=Mycena metata TaxID=1033252 RepID=A0AAD7K6I7_9AGAR|nr:aspartic peptidase domain-containing protein [Mycena metata]
MNFLSVLSVLLLLGAANATALEHPRTLIPRAPLPPAEFSVPITGKVPRRKSKSNALARRGHLGGGGGYTSIVDGTLGDNEFVTNVTIGGQHFSLIIDTGSSDTWAIQKGFQCLSADGTRVPQSTCGFGSSGFDVNGSTTFQPSNLSFLGAYGNGWSVAGPVGYDTVAIGGLSVEHQLVPIPNAAYYTGDGVNSGVLGLAFPTVTSVYNTTDPANATTENHLLYNPFFFTAVKEKKVKHPYFSLTLDRGTFQQRENDTFDANLGLLSFGGISPVAVVEPCVTVPIQGYSTNSTGSITPSDSPDAQYFWYTVDVANYGIAGSAELLTGSNNTILDSGTGLNNVPPDVAAAFAAAFNPPAVLTNLTAGLELYVVDCNATAPEFLVHIGGKTFSIDPQDQIVPLGADAQGNEICVSGTQGGTLTNNPNGILILGDVFFHNVVITFNPIDGEVTITQRAKY